MDSNRKLDLIAGVVFIAIAAAIIFIAIPYGVQEPKKVKFAALSPSYYPRLVCYCLLGFGAILSFTRLLPSRVQNGSSDDADEQQSVPFVKLHRLIAIAIILAFYYLTLNSLGFVVSSAIVLLALLLLAGDRNPWALVILPTLLPISVYWFFTKVANIPIPAGILESLLVGS